MLTVYERYHSEFTIVIILKAEQWRGLNWTAPLCPLSPDLFAEIAWFILAVWSQTNWGEMAGVRGNAVKDLSSCFHTVSRSPFSPW